MSKRHYQQLHTCSVATAFDDSWKEEVDKKVCELPTDCVENVLDREIDLEEIALCVRKLKNNKVLNNR